LSVMLQNSFGLNPESKKRASERSIDHVEFLLSHFKGWQNYVDTVQSTFVSPLSHSKGH
jgi:hypothetical protein